VTWLAVVLLPGPALRWRAFRGVARFFAWAQGVRIETRGVDNLPSGGRYLVVANHFSYIDSYVIPAALPARLRIVAKVELTRNALIRVFLERLSVEFVERFDKQRGIADARRIGRDAASGVPLMFYPEGGTWRSPGLRPFHMGAFIVAVESGLPVVPVAVAGTRSVFRSDSWFPRPGRVRVTVGEPIPADPHAPDSWSAALALRDAARAHVLAHCAEPDLTV
jgi:1-acyl-sn-glycerol-3-phosphate acyltransferase